MVAGSRPTPRQRTYAAMVENQMDTVSQEFPRLYYEWMEAVRSRDMPSLDRVLAAEYVYTASGQSRVDRQRWLEMVSMYDLQTFEFTQLDVRLYGEVALVLCEYRQTGTVAGEARTGTFFITDVWVRRDRRWQVVARSAILT